MKVGVLLSGSGVYDGSEIQESVLVLLALEEMGAEVICFAPNVTQFHVVNHLSGEEMDETRNVLVESARIARGDIDDIVNMSSDDFDALVIPGGFGTAKNHTTWAVDGPLSEINVDVKRLILETVKHIKPIVALCMAPTTVAKALEGSGFHPRLTVGSDVEKSPYEIKGISEGLQSIGAHVQMCSITEICVDHELRIISAPCYMMSANIVEVRKNIFNAVSVVSEFVK
jgi:enhancing lycopene biosynthesis protein 2